MFKNRKIHLIVYSLLIAGAVFLIIAAWWIFAIHIYPLNKKVISADHGIYELAAPFPVMITESGGTSYKNKFYIAGGIGWYAQTHKHFYEYDPSKDKWTKLPDLPEPINHPCVVGNVNKIYIVGGFEPIGIRLRGFMFADWKPLRTMYVYDIVTKKWEKGSGLPEPRGAGACTVFGNELWYVGGINAQKNVSDHLYKYSFISNTWSQMPSMKIARDHLRMEAIDGKLYAISGRKDDLRFNLNQVECFDIHTGSWSLKADFPVPRGGFSSVVFDNKIYTFGGENVWSCFDNVERYDPKLDTWEKLSPMPEARHGIQAGVINGKIHLITGGHNPRISVSGIHRVFSPYR